MSTKNHTPTVSEIITCAREEQGMSLRDFSAYLGVSHQSIALWENGTTTPDEKRLTAWMHSETYWVREMAIRIMACHKWDVMVMLKPEC